MRPRQSGKPLERPSFRSYGSHRVEQARGMPTPALPTPPLSARRDARSELSANGNPHPKRMMLAELASTRMARWSGVQVRGTPYMFWTLVWLGEE
jgi:hypothetical protein